MICFSKRSYRSSLYILAKCTVQSAIFVKKYTLFSALSHLIRNSTLLLIKSQTKSTLLKIQNPSKP